MVFTSPLFLFVFLPTVIGLYFALPDRLRNAWLLAASLAFYLVGAGSYIVVLLGVFAAAFASAHWIEKSPPNRRRLVLSISLITCLLPLIVFKYGAFLAASCNSLNAALNLPQLPVPSWFLPAGISFFTFQACSYLIDVYRAHIPACRSGTDYALSLTYFPHLVAGPILRYEALAEALKKRTHSHLAIAEGLCRFGLGLSKKVLLADNLGRIADPIFNRTLTDLSTPLAWLGLAAYTLQIFFDFSGYSDMAIGLGRVFALPLPENFRQPYTATSVTDFWRRWHLTLSQWFRDYVYIPLGGNRHGAVRTALHLSVVFILCGLWHGANITFLLWGLYHGTLLISERLCPEHVTRSIPRVIKTTLTFTLVALGWVLFRSPSLPSACTYFAALAGHAPTDTPVFHPGFFLTINNLVYLAVAFVCAFWPEPAPRAQKSDTLTARLYPWLILGLTTLAVIGQSPHSFNPFIYFQF